MGFGQQQANGAAQDQKAVLQQRENFLERQLDRIKRQLSRLAGEQPSRVVPPSGPPGA
jgi:hypothetical protein